MQSEASLLQKEHTNHKKKVVNLKELQQTQVQGIDEDLAKQTHTKEQRKVFTQPGSNPQFHSIHHKDILLDKDQRSEPLGKQRLSSTPYQKSHSIKSQSLSIALPPLIDNKTQIKKLQINYEQLVAERSGYLESLSLYNNEVVELTRELNKWQDKLRFIDKKVKQVSEMKGQNAQVQRYSKYDYERKLCQQQIERLYQKLKTTNQNIQSVIMKCEKLDSIIESHCKLIQKMQKYSSTKV